MEHERRESNIETILKLDQIIEYNQRQDKSISEIHKIVTGNGNPENGLIVKTTRMSEKIKNMTTTLKIHWGLLILVIGVAVKTAFF